MGIHGECLFDRCQDIISDVSTCNEGLLIPVKVCPFTKWPYGCTVTQGTRCKSLTTGHISHCKLHSYRSMGVNAPYKILIDPIALFTLQFRS